MRCHVNDRYYLKSNIQIEPLVDQWYAWPYLIPPAAAARNLTERNVKIMDSYVAAPQVHAAAVRNPKLLGGPFIDYDRNRVCEVTALREATRTKRASLIRLSLALCRLDAELNAHPKGMSLEPLYSKLPPELNGYVELVYDLNNHAGFRLIEPLLYHSEYYDRTAQSLMLSEITSDDRPFVLSTPRLESEDAIHWRVPFDDHRIDALSRLQSESQPWAVVREMFDNFAGSEQTLQSLFTTDPPPPYVPYTGNGVRWRYFGHACILVETQGLSFLFDPVLSYTYESHISRYSYRDLPDRIDFALITHNHTDHIMFETMLQLRHKVKTIVVPRSSGRSLQDPSLKLILNNMGFSNVVELRELDTLGEGVVTITGIPFFGEHCDLDITTKICYHLRVGSFSMIIAADSCNLEPDAYRKVTRFVGSTDVLFLGMECDGGPMSWVYGPLLSQKMERRMDESRRLSGSNCDQGMQMVDVFGCREVYVYAMGQEPWLNYLMSIKYTEQSRPIIESNKLIAECARRGIVAERLFGEKEILVPCGFRDVTAERRCDLQ